MFGVFLAFFQCSYCNYNKHKRLSYYFHSHVPLLKSGDFETVVGGFLNVQVEPEVGNAAYLRSECIPT